MKSYIDNEGNRCFTFEAKAVSVKSEGIDNLIANLPNPKMTMTFKKKKPTICEKAVETFGVISQLDQAQEEAAELIEAISKYKRALNSRDFDRIQLQKSKLLMEMADNTIMNKQLMIITGFSHEDLKSAMKCKLKKLLNYIKLGVK